MASETALVVPEEIVSVFEQMEPRHVALLMAKIWQPERSLEDISKEMWPELKIAMRKRIIARSHVHQVYQMVRDKPWILAAIMGTKLAPLAVATLYEMMIGASKENVRVTAAKEVLALGRNSWTKFLRDPDAMKLPAVEELDEALKQEMAALEREGGDDEDEEFELDEVGALEAESALIEG